jgi:hypothetical protein
VHVSVALLFLPQHSRGAFAYPAYLVLVPACLCAALQFSGCVMLGHKKQLDLGLVRGVQHP